MKKNKGLEFERTEISWDEFAKEISGNRPDQDEGDKYEWDRPLVDETWSVDDPVTGELPKIPEDKPKETPKKEPVSKGLTGLLPSEDAIYNATLNEDLDLSAAISRKLNAVAESHPVDEQAIRSSVDQKIVIKSEELKGKREMQDGAPKRKVRRRIPKSTDPEKGRRLSAEEKRNLKYKHTELKEDPKMSEFRERSMNWKDGANENGTHQGEGEAADLSGAFSRIFMHFKRYTALEWVSVILAIIIVASSAMTTAVYANYKGEQNRAKAIASLKRFEEADEQRVAETVVEEEETAAVSAPEQAVEIKSLSLVLTSVEKDLKIKLVDQDDSLVKNLPWGVTITDKDGKVSDNDDDDEDGIIYLTDIGAGDYSVALKPSDALADYILPQSAQTVSVKAKVEYKVIANIKDEIKSEKEVNAAVEDNGNKPADVETTTVTDTVEWVESTKTANGDAWVEAVPDLSKSLTTASSFSPKNIIANALRSLSARIHRSYGTVLGAPLLVAENNDPTENTTPEETTTTQDSPPSPTLTGVSVSGTSLKVGDTATISVSGDNLEGASISYSASGDCISISGTTVKAEKPGTATVSATLGETTVTSDTITVSAKEPDKKPVTNISVTLSATSITVGATATASASVTPEDASNRAVTWSSDNTGIATVDSNGSVKGVSAGSTTIKATAADGSGVVGSATITVSNAKVLVTNLTIKPDNCSIAEGGNYQLTLSVEPTTADKSVKWTTSNAGVATVTDGGLVKGVKKGTAKITATATDGSGKSATCTIEVTEKEPDPGAQLYDKDKNPLYKRMGDGSYVLAKYADYKADKTIKLYKKEQGYLYTGWQTIDGKTYYYKKDNTYVTGDQIIGGVTYHFATDGSLTQGSGTLGIDVSKYQPSINWTSVKNSGVSFVIIRCGYRGSSTGVLIEDPYFKSHIKGAKAAGLKVGVYFFTTAMTEAEAIEEASMCAYLCSGYGINYPVFMDCESSNRPGYNGIGAAERTQIIKAFCNTLKSAGYTPGVYANKTWLTEKMSASSLSGYKIWLAQYNAAGPTYNGRYDLWQYTSKGSVSGISGNVDMNQSYLGY